MEHIVQFGINIDDEAIRKAIENNVQKRVEISILEDVKREITGSKNYSDWIYSTKLKELITNATNAFLEEYKAEIIEETSKKLVEKLARTKAVKEMVSNMIGQMEIKV